MSEFLDDIRANRQLWRDCPCPTHTAVHELVGYATKLELQLARKDDHGKEPDREGSA